MTIWKAPHIYCQLIFYKSVKTIKWWKKSPLNKWCWKNWLSRCETQNLNPYLISYTNITQNESKTYKSENYQTFRRKRGHKMPWPWIRQWLLSYEIKACKKQKRKPINWTSPKLKTSVPQKTPSRKLKDNTRNGRKYLQIIYAIRDLYLEYMNNS